MTDIEIDRALALAIGWKEDDIALVPGVGVEVWVGHLRWKYFNHRDWTVISPIAERYDCFPLRLRGREWEAISRGKYKLEFVKADTPQRAIALAVIRAKQ